jgi:hypothetical protein
VWTQEKRKIERKTMAQRIMYGFIFIIIIIIIDCVYLSIKCWGSINEIEHRIGFFFQFLMRL